MFISHEFFLLSLQYLEDDDVVRPTAGAAATGTPVIGVQSSKMGAEDIQLHIQSDHGTGGHWCAKIIFFSLMAVLIGLIGLILLENRGISDCKFNTRMTSTTAN